MLYSWLQASWNIILLSAPWLLFGLFCAGIIHVLLPKTFIKVHLEHPGLKSVLKASVFGIPLPLCSCSVIPVGVSLRRGGASRGATASFFVSTPEIGIDSFLLSYVLLGLPLAIIRIVAVLISAVGTGISIDKFTTQSNSTSSSPQTEKCCVSDPDKPSLPNRQGASSRLHRSFEKLIRAFHFGYIELFDDLGAVLSIGFLGAGLVTVLVPDDLFQNFGLGPFSMMLIMLVTALPMYVCATSSTPLIAALLAKGLSPGAALVFLLAGPATNISTMLVVGKELGKQALTLYITGIMGGAILCGVLTDMFMNYSGTSVPSLVHGGQGSHDHGLSVCGLILIALLLASFLRRSWRIIFANAKLEKS